MLQTIQMHSVIGAMEFPAARAAWVYERSCARMEKPYVLRVCSS